MNAVGFQKLTIDQMTQTFSKEVEGLSLNLSASAKGYAVDRLAQILEEKKIMNYLIEIGGEMSISGKKPDAPWRVAIESPVENQRSVHKVLRPMKGGLAALWELPKLL